MLPSSGYFRGIVCPGQLRGACNRPYCHFRHDMKVSTEKNNSPSASSSQAAVPTPVQEEADAVEEEKLEEIEHQIMSKEVSECSSASLAPAVTTPSEPEEQQSQPHTSQQQESVTASDEVPKSEILQQLMSEALKKVLAENPTLASTVDASSIRIGIDPVTQESPEVNKTKKQLYHRPPDTPNYNPTPIRELKKRKQSVDGVHNLVYNPTCSRTTGDKGSGDEGDVMGEFSSDESEEVEEKNDDFDLLEEVLAEHSKNNKVKVKKKKVKELGKLQYSLSNTHKTTVDNSIMITDAKKLSDKEVKKYELPQTESVNKIITDGPYFLPPSPIFTSSSDGFEAFSARAARQEEETSVPEECVDKAPPHAESVKTNSQPATEKKMTPKQTTEQPKPSSQPENAEKVTKASGHTHLPQLLSARGAPKLSRPNVRTWTPLVRNNIPSSETQKTTDQLDEILQLMDGSDPSNKRKLKENEHQTSNQRDSENARPKKKYKVDLNKEIESLSNPALEHSKESVTPEEPAKQQPEPTNSQDSDKKQSTKEESVSDEKDATKKASPKESEEKKQTDESEAASVESEDSEGNTLSQESGNDSEFKQSRHRKKRKRKRSHSSSSGSDYSHHRRKKRKRSRKRHHKRSKRSRRRRDSTSSQSDQSQESEEEREEKKNDDDEEEEENYDTEEEEENEEEDKENKSKEDSESEDEDSNDDIEHTRKSKRHRKKHKYYKKLKHRRNKHKARRKRKRSKSYSRSRSTGKSRDSSRSRSRSGSQSRSSSKHRKKRNRSRHKSRNYSDSDNRDSSKENSRSRSSSRSSSKHKRRGSREDDSSGSRHRESSKSKDKRVDEESNKSRKEDRRERSSSKVDQQTSDDKKSKNHNDEEISIPMPVDPSKIKVEKNALVPDLSKVKIEKEDPLSEKSNGQVSVNAKSKESSCKGQSESSQSKVAEKVPEQRRPSSEDKNRRKKSHERKDSTESTSDKAPHRRQSCDSKASDNEGSMQRKKTEERRSSTEKIKRSQSISSQPSEMSMFDLVLASAETSKPTKTLIEISMFNSMARASTNHSLEASGTKNKSKDASHKGSGENAVSSEHKSSSSDKTSKSSRPDKTAHTDSHHKHTKSDSKTSHSISKSKSSSSSSSSSHHISSSHKRTSSTSSRSSTSKHHSTSIATTTTATTTTTTTATTTTTPSSSSKTPDGSSSNKNRKSSDPSSSKSEKESSRHSSTSSRKHSSSSNKHHDSSTSRRSSSSSRHKDSKESTTETAKNNMGSEITKKRRVSADEESQGGVSDHDQPSSGVDSPLPDLSMLDEISQDDWEQMISGMDGANQEPSEETEGDDMDTDNPWVLEECMKMFNEFQPEENHLENQVLPKKMKAAVEDKEPPKSSSKQRVARSSTGNLMAKKTSRSHHQKTSPMQMMVERYQRLKEQLKMKEKQLHHLQGGPSSVTSSSSSKTSVPAPSSSSSSYHSPSSQGSGKSKKRIAHVPNVNSLLSAQEKIKKQTHSNISSRISPKVARASGVIPETTAHTVAKGGKRIAHTPKIGALAKPIIQPELGSLVPQNIRQRYLNALIEECKKFTSEKESFNIAAAEERVCYKRAPSRMVYLNLVVNAVKRLRTQQQAGEEAQELLDKDPQLAEKMCIEEPSPSTTKPSPPVSSPSSSRSHPINPNHVQLSHTSVLSSGGIRGSWSIEKPKKSSASQEDIKGNALYKNLTKYILTEEQLEENGYPCPDPEEKGKAIVKKIDSRKKISPSALERYCDRCSVLYTVDKWGFPKNSAPCVYHWGRAYKKRKYGTFETSYSCCGGEQGSGGCSQATTHVSENYNPKNLRGYVRTISKDSSSSNKEVYALDCEMCYTTEGNELTRITVINSSGDVVYEQLVKPENPILDYNTRFSGITENDMEDVKLTIRDVQAALLARFSDKTILIGHSLESDLHALKIIHATVVDTSVVFPHKMGAPYKRALKNLAAEYLKRIIQDDVSGHDSAEDAIACLHLMQWKVKEDLKGFSK